MKRSIAIPVDSVEPQAINPDGHRLTSGAANGMVTIWDATPLPAQP
jgi:hypothetical protein